MQIIYADDEPGTLTEVCTFLQQHGHRAEAVSTTNILDFQKEVNAALQHGFSPDAIVIGGHNVLRNGEGEALFDIDAFVITNWLEKIKVPEKCLVLLYSRDASLVERALQHKEWGFDAAIVKGRSDSLPSLLQSIETKN